MNFKQLYNLILENDQKSQVANSVKMVLVDLIKQISYRIEGYDYATNEITKFISAIIKSLDNPRSIAYMEFPDFGTLNFDEPENTTDTEKNQYSNVLRPNHDTVNYQSTFELIQYALEIIPNILDNPTTSDINDFITRSANCFRYTFPNEQNAQQYANMKENQYKQWFNNII